MSRPEIQAAEFGLQHHLKLRVVSKENLLVGSIKILLLFVELDL